MNVTRVVSETRAAVAAARGRQRRIGCVPTMGALHAGHLSLVSASRRRGDYVVTTIFVNPTQFGPGEDLSRYPRDEAGDLAKCEAAGVDQVFIPAVEEMYRPDAVTSVHVAGLTDTLCGPQRPGHFDGVATVVLKLFNIVQPDAAYFGEKDAQQLAVIRRMSRDLDLPIEIVGCPIVREPDGLAMSSRNVYLSAAERQQALVLNRALQWGRDRLLAGQDSIPPVIVQMRAMILQSGPVSIDYVSAVDPLSMQPVERVDGPVLLAVAVRIGRTRLIDNTLADPFARRNHLVDPGAQKS